MARADRGGFRVPLYPRSLYNNYSESTAQLDERALFIALRELATPPTAFPRLRLRLEGILALGSLCVFLILNLIFLLSF